MIEHRLLRLLAVGFIVGWVVGFTHRLVKAGAEEITSGAITEGTPILSVPMLHPGPGVVLRETGAGSYKAVREKPTRKRDKHCFEVNCRITNKAECDPCTCDGTGCHCLSIVTPPCIQVYDTFCARGRLEKAENQNEVSK